MPIPEKYKERLIKNAEEFDAIVVDLCNELEHYKKLAADRGDELQYTDKVSNKLMDSPLSKINWFNPNGVKMTTKQINNQAELEKVINEDFKSITVDNSIIPFGRFSGWSVEDVPNYYLDWLLSEDTLEEKSVYNYLLKPVEEEVEYRKTYNIFIEG